VGRFDAAVVGAGPAGSAAAICLARRGYAVALIDKAVFPRDKLCGDFLNPAGWSLFARLGIRDALLASDHQKVTAFRVSTASAEALIPFTRVFGVGMRRRAFDDLLVKQAVREGALLYEGVKLTALERDGDGWKLRGENGAEEREFLSRLVIGADGRNSWTAHRLGAIAARLPRAGRRDSDSRFSRRLRRRHGARRRRGESIVRHRQDDRARTTDRSDRRESFLGSTRSTSRRAAAAATAFCSRATPRA
jgi:flavin-dependent dehydrogenase